MFREKYVWKRKKSLKNFETETSLKKIDTGTPTQISHFVMYFLFFIYQKFNSQ